jgi:hypothetical protein
MLPCSRKVFLALAHSGSGLVQLIWPLLLKKGNGEGRGPGITHCPTISRDPINTAHHASFHPGGGEGAVDKAAVVEFAHEAAVDDLLPFDLADARVTAQRQALNVAHSFSNGLIDVSVQLVPASGDFFLHPSVYLRTMRIASLSN